MARLAADLVSIDSRSSLSNLPIAERIEAELAGFEIERIVPAGQWVRLDFLAHRVFSGRPRAGAAAVRALRAIGAGGVRAWVPSGSIAVVAARPGDGRSRDREADGGEPS